MASVKILAGDCRRSLRQLPDKSVHCIITSPPYFRLRDNNTGEWRGGNPRHKHINNGNRCSCGARYVDRGIGMEITPREYVDKLIKVFRQAHRVLRDDGILFLNLGDSYATARAGNTKHTIGHRGISNSIANVLQRIAHVADKAHIPGLPQGNLLQIPERVAIALQSDGWILRDRIIWYKPSHLPTSSKTRSTACYEFIYMFTKQANKYYYDWWSAVEPAITQVKTVHWKDKLYDQSFLANKQLNGIKGRPRGVAGYSAPGIKNSRNIWIINPGKFKGAHFSTFPPDLVERAIKIATSDGGVCSNCGKPFVRKISKRRIARLQNYINGNVPDLAEIRQYITRGWQPVCKCQSELSKPIVLDPFGGAMTTALVANQLGRRVITCELNNDYIKLGRQRLQQYGIKSHVIGG